MLEQVELTQEDLWEVMRAFIEDEGLVQHHLRSYNYFVKEGLRELIKSLGDTTSAPTTTSLRRGLESS